MGVRSLVAALVVVVTVVAVSATAATARPFSTDAAPEVLVIGDSIATGMLWHPDAIQILQEGLAVDWQVAICRTIGGVSCPFDGERPPTLLELVPTLGHVPPDVVVELGYNDDLSAFPTEVDEAVAALVAAGAQRIHWLTLHEWGGPYAQMNADLRAATHRHPQLELIDWNAAAQNEYHWFQSDGIHLLEEGGVAMAHLVHAALMHDLDPLRITSPRPRLRFRHTYSLRLGVEGGTAPYTWRVAAGRPPHGIHLLADGRLYGRVEERNARGFELAVTDADGATVTEKV